MDDIIDKGLSIYAAFAGVFIIALYFLTQYWGFK